MHIRGNIQQDTHALCGSKHVKDAKSLQKKKKKGLKTKREND